MIRKRWRRAQSYELGFWKKHADIVNAGGGHRPRDLWYVEAEDLGGKRVLEVGCGPSGAIYFCKGALRVGIDPLAADYMREIRFSRRGVELLASMGEHLPFGDAAFDAVIIGNVLDHVNEAAVTLAEIRRVLKREGIMIAWMHVIPGWLVPLRKVLDLIDGGHPYHMTQPDARAIVARSGLAISEARETETGLGWRSGWKAALANVALRNLLLKARPAA